MRDSEMKYRQNALKFQISRVREINNFQVIMAILVVSNRKWNKLGLNNYVMNTSSRQHNVFTKQDYEYEFLLFLVLQLYYGSNKLQVNCKYFFIKMSSQTFLKNFPINTKQLTDIKDSYKKSNFIFYSVRHNA